MAVAHQLEHRSLFEDRRLIIDRSVTEVESQSRMHLVAFRYADLITHSDHLALRGFQQQKSVHRALDMYGGDRFSRDNAQAYDTEQEQRCEMTASETQSADN